MSSLSISKCFKGSLLTLMLLSLEALSNDNVLADLSVPVDSEGVYSVKVGDLNSKGIDVKGLRLKDLSITLNGKSITRAGYTLKDGSLERILESELLQSTTIIDFIASKKDLQSVKSLYEDKAVYRLERSSSELKAKSVSNHNARPRGEEYNTYFLDDVTHEPQRIYESDTSSDDPWLAGTMMAFKGLSSEHSETISLKDPYDAGSFRIKSHLFGASDNTDIKDDHRVVVYIDGRPKSKAKFGGKEEEVVKTVSSMRDLKSSSFTVKYKVPGTSASKIIDRIELDRIEVTYPRKFIARQGHLDFVKDSKLPYKVSNLAESNVRGYVVINNDEAAQLKNMKKLSSSNGKASYAFSGVATRANYYVTSAYNSPVIKKSVQTSKSSLLKGDYVVIAAEQYMSDNNLKRLLNQRQSEGLSTNLVSVEEVYSVYSHGHRSAEAIDSYIKDMHAEGAKYVLLVGNTSNDMLNYTTDAVSDIPSSYSKSNSRHLLSDAAYADVDGDTVADIAVGRFPVKNARELKNMVNKTLNYKGLTSGVSLVADVKQERSFKSELLGIANSSGIGEKAEVSEVFYDDISDVAKVKSLLQQDFSNSGVVAYYGHGLVNGLGRAIKLFEMDDLDGIPHGAGSVFYGMSCTVLDYTNAGRDGLVRSMLVSPTGSAASIGGVTLLSVSKTSMFTKSLLSETTEGSTLGQIFLNAKQSYTKKYATKLSEDIHNGIILLGDPAMKL